MRDYLWRFDPSRYSRAYLFGQVHERKVVEDIITGLARFRFKIEKVDAGAGGLRQAFYGAMLGAGISERQAKAIISNLKRSATTVGFSDLLGVLAPTGQSVFVEAKQPAWIDPVSGRFIRYPEIPTPAQLEFLDEKSKLGAIVGVAWSIQDAIEIIGLDKLELHRKNLKKSF